MNIFDLNAKLGLDSSEFNRGLNDAEASANRSGSAIGTAAKVAGAALAATTTAAVAFGTASVKTGMSFDSAMSQVQATMLKTSEEMENDVGSVDTAYGHFEGNLRDFAQFLGQNTTFSATQAAEALNYMALAGYNTQESMDMLPNVLSLAASAEQRSEHPLGKAIVKQAKEENLALFEPEQFAMQSGKGIQANIRGRSVLCGSEKWIEEKGVAVLQSDRDALQALRSTGSAVILTAADGKLVGLTALSDTPRKGVGSMVEQLESLNVDTVLLTGDNRQTAEFFARQNGLTRFEAELLPGEKAKAIQTLQAEGRSVCMIGDGVNDAPALKTANIGIAMGKVGSDVAVEAADIVLMTEDLGRIGYLKKLSNAAIQSITVNISLSMGINFVAIILSMLGIMGPVTGALVHNAGSVLVILNAALLYDRKFN